MSLKLICRAGHYARHGDQHGRNKTTDLGADQDVFGGDIGGSIPGAQRGSQPVYRAVFKRFGYAPHSRADKGVLLRYFERMTGLSRQQVTWLVERYHKNGKLTKQPCKPKQGFTYRYTAADARNTAMRTRLRLMKNSNQYPKQASISKMASRSNNWMRKLQNERQYCCLGAEQCKIKAV